MERAATERCKSRLSDTWPGIPEHHKVTLDQRTVTSPESHTTDNALSYSVADRSRLFLDRLRNVASEHKPLVNMFAHRDGHGNYLAHVRLPRQLLTRLRNRALPGASYYPVRPDQCAFLVNGAGG